MIPPIAVRAGLRLFALALVGWGLIDENAASVIYTDPDIVGAVSLLVAEVYFYATKLIERYRA